MDNKSILITGASGFVGRHLLNRLAIEGGNKIFTTDKELTNIFPYTPKSLDWVIHLASSHRELEEKQVYEINMRLNTAIINLLTAAGLTANILFTSSIHEVGDSFYGKSKKEGAVYLETKCKSWSTRFEKIVFPNLFGPHSKPYHTSVVANFCADIIAEKESYINNVKIKLMYVQEAINSILKFESQNEFETTTVYLPELYETIKKLHERCKLNPFEIRLASQFESQLLTTLTSYY